ncbi:hypothetical protein PO909_020317 [Leuciscus waleckii]
MCVKFLCKQQCEHIRDVFVTVSSVVFLLPAVCPTGLLVSVELLYVKAKNDETGVMDCLLEALQSGAAFRDRRKRAPRPRGESTHTPLTSCHH